MEKHPSLLYKILVVGIIVLFIGVGIQPAIAVKPDTSEGEDDCNLCAKKLSISHLVLIESLLNRLEKIDYELSLITKLNPTIEEKYKVISNRISEIKEINIDNILQWEFPIICTFLCPLWFLSVYFYELGFNIISFIAYPIFLIVNSLVILLDCYWLNTK